MSKPIISRDNSFTLAKLRRLCKFIPGSGSEAVLTARRSDRILAQFGFLDQGDHIAVWYQTRGGTFDQTPQTIRYDWSRQHFGGLRAWLRCPECDRRALTYVYNGGRFICRRCAGAAYPIENQEVFDRLMDQIRYIREERLEWPPGCREGMKPRRMRGATFNRLREEAERKEVAALLGGLAQISPESTRRLLTAAGK